MERDLHYFVEILLESCADIHRDFFELPQARADRVYRERVYCYELYHQMRSRWGGFQYSLGGEIDKGGHPVFHGGPYARAKPDFLIHLPGDMDGNLAIAEVKASTASLASALVDIKKLLWFCGEPARYHRGIFLVFGIDKEFEQLRRQVVATRDDWETLPIVLIKHVQIGSRAEVIPFISVT